MVGRLVQEQQVGPAPGQQRERAARLLAAGHRTDRARGHFGAEAELAEKIAQFLFARLRVGVQRQPAQVLQRRLVGAQLIELVLCEVADRQAVASAQLAAGRRKFAGDAPDQRRLAGAVDAEDADAVARADQELDPVEDRARTVGQAQVLGVEQSLGQPARRGKLEAPLAAGARRFDCGQSLERVVRRRIEVT